MSALFLSKSKSVSQVSWFGQLLAVQGGGNWVFLPAQLNNQPVAVKVWIGIPLFPGAVEIQEVNLVALAIGREPFVRVCDSGLVQHGKSVARCFVLVGQNGGE